MDAFDNKLRLPEDTQIILRNFIEEEVFPGVTKIAEKLQHLTDTIHNFSEKDLQTIIWYIETYAKYQTEYGKSQPEVDILWLEDLNHLINLVSVEFKYRYDKHDTFMNILHEIYGSSAGNHIVLGEKAQQIKYHLETFPTIMSIYFEAHKTNPEALDFISDSLLGPMPISRYKNITLFFPLLSPDEQVQARLDLQRRANLLKFESSLERYVDPDAWNFLRLQKKEKLIEVIKSYPDVRDLLLELAILINDNIDISNPEYQYPSNFAINNLLFFEAIEGKSLMLDPKAYELVDLVIEIELTTIFDSHPHFDKISQLVNSIRARRARIR